MKLILRFLKPHWKLCALTIILLIVDVAGALFIPTLVAEILNSGTSGATFDAIVQTGFQMAVVSVLAGLCAILGGYACAVLSAQVGKLDFLMQSLIKMSRLETGTFALHMQHARLTIPSPRP